MIIKLNSRENIMEIKEIYSGYLDKLEALMRISEKLLEKVSFTELRLIAEIEGFNGLRNQETKSEFIEGVVLLGEYYLERAKYYRSKLIIRPTVSPTKVRL